MHLRLYFRLQWAFWILVLGALAAAPLAWSGEFDRFPEQKAKPAGSELDPAEIEQLKELLRQAQELQKAEAAKQDAATPAKAAEATDASDPASAEAKKAAEPEKQVLARPGCMYRGPKLIWEKVPGTCAP